MNQRTENIGRVFSFFQTLPHRFTAVVDAHYAGVIVGTGDGRRVQSITVFVKQVSKIMDKQGEFPEGGSVPAVDDSLSASSKFSPASGTVEGSSCLFDDQCSEYAVKLMRIGEQVVMEEYRVKLCICKETFDQCLILSGSGNIIPAICGTIGDDGVEFYQMNVISRKICQSVHLEGTFLNIFRKKVGKANFDAVSCICPYDKRFYTDFLFFDFADIRVEAAVEFQIFFQDKEPSLWIVPAVAVISDLRLNYRNFKYLYFGMFRAGAGFGIKGSGSIIFHKICPFHIGG